MPVPEKMESSNNNDASGDIIKKNPGGLGAGSMAPI